MLSAPPSSAERARTSSRPNSYSTERAFERPFQVHGGQSRRPVDRARSVGLCRLPRGTDRQAVLYWQELDPTVPSVCAVISRTAAGPGTIYPPVGYEERRLVLEEHFPHCQWPESSYSRRRVSHDLHAGPMPIFVIAQVSLLRASKAPVCGLWIRQSSGGGRSLRTEGSRRLLRTRFCGGVSMKAVADFALRSAIRPLGGCQREFCTHCWTA
jgi:hypothetical protein